MKRLFSLLLILCCAFTVGCGPEKEKKTVVATLFPQYDFCRQIAGDRLEVRLLLPPGTESHNYEPSVRDMLLIRDCDLFVFTGPDMEAWADTVLDSLEKREVLDVSLSTEKLPEHDEEDEDRDEHEEHEEHDEHGHHDHDHGVYDPHIWTSPKNARKIAEAITEALCALDPAGEECYRANAACLLSELDGLDREFKALAASVGDTTFCHGGHFAMRYLAHDYGFKIEAAFDSCSSEAEPGLKTVRTLTDTVRAQGLKAVLYEELTVPRVAETIAAETGTETLLLHSCHNVSRQEMDAGVTYASLMRQNIENLRKAWGKEK